LDLPDLEIPITKALWKKYAELTPIWLQKCALGKSFPKNPIFLLWYLPLFLSHPKGIILWEIIIRVIAGAYVYPYSEYTDIKLDLQIAVAVSERNLRPTLPTTIPKILYDLVHRCYKTDPLQRPSSGEALNILLQAEAQFQRNKEQWQQVIMK
jgi:hypothetical protein